MSKNYFLKCQKNVIYLFLTFLQNTICKKSSKKKFSRCDNLQPLRRHFVSSPTPGTSIAFYEIAIFSPTDRGFFSGTAWAKNGTKWLFFNLNNKDSRAPHFLTFLGFPKMLMDFLGHPPQGELYALGHFGRRCRNTQSLNPQRSRPRRSESLPPHHLGRVTEPRPDTPHNRPHQFLPHIRNACTTTPKPPI